MMSLHAGEKPYFDQEYYRFPTVKKSMIICESEVHHLVVMGQHRYPDCAAADTNRSDLHFAVDCNRLLLYRMQA